MTFGKTGRWFGCKLGADASCGLRDAAEHPSRHRTGSGTGIQPWASSKKLEGSALNKSRRKHSYKFSMCCQCPWRRLFSQQNDCWLFCGECENVHSSKPLRRTCYCLKYFVIMKRALCSEGIHAYIFESHWWKGTRRFVFNQSDTL